MHFSYGYHLQPISSLRYGAFASLFRISSMILYIISVRDSVCASVCVCELSNRFCYGNDRIVRLHTQWYTFGAGFSEKTNKIS